MLFAFYVLFSPASMAVDGAITEEMERRSDHYRRLKQEADKEEGSEEAKCRFADYLFCGRNFIKEPKDKWVKHSYWAPADHYWLCHNSLSKEDSELAFEYYKQAAEKGHLESLVSLAKCYQYGKGVQKDYRKVIMYLRTAAKEGDGSAQYSLGFIYWSEALMDGVTEEESEAETQELKSSFLRAYLKKSDKSDNRMENNNRRKAFHWFLQAAEQNANGQNVLGKIYEQSVSTDERKIEHDDWDVRKVKKALYKKAVNYFMRAAQNNHVDAQCRLGYMYMKGWVGKKQREQQEEGQPNTNFYLAKKWLLLAVTQGHKGAECYMGDLYWNLNSEESPDIFHAMKWTESAAIKGDVGAMLQFGDMYKIWFKDDLHANEWYEKARKTNENDAQKKELLYSMM